MANLIQAIRGMHDVLPEQTPLWQHVENVIRKVLNAYGYSEIRLPIVEKTELFKLNRRSHRYCRKRDVHV